MSDNLDAIHAQTCATFEKLYNEKGQPDELHETFLQEYFKLVKDDLNFDAGDLNFDAGEDGINVLSLNKTVVNLSKADTGLVEVYIPFKKEKFVVSRTESSVKVLDGVSQRFGAGRGKGTYVMTNIKGFPNVTIRTNGAVVNFVGLPNKVTSESGRGEWVKV